MCGISIHYYTMCRRKTYKRWYCNTHPGLWHVPPTNLYNSLNKLRCMWCTIHTPRLSSSSAMACRLFFGKLLLLLLLSLSSAASPTNRAQDEGRPMRLRTLPESIKRSWYSTEDLIRSCLVVCGRSVFNSIVVVLLILLHTSQLIVASLLWQSETMNL